MPSEYRLKRRVQFYETDMAGIVHFSWYFRYLEEAEHAMWREAGLSIAGGHGIAWPRTAASFEFHRPLKFEDEFEVHLRIVGKDARSIRYEGVITSAGTRVATGKLVIKCVSKRPGEPMRGIDIPPDIDALFQVAPAAKPGDDPSD
jgi:YbgC/YbaW family acyl-CoA thioester hydrolase